MIDMFDGARAFCLLDSCAAEKMFTCSLLESRDKTQWLEEEISTRTILLLETRKDGGE